MRWIHPEKGLIPPDTFIPACEASGIIGDLGKIVLTQAAAAQKVWASQGHDLRVSVNLSPVQFGEETLVDDLLEIMLKTDCSPHCVELEITESVAAKSLHEANAKLQELSDFGVQIALDDFGTGFSSLSYLQQLTCDVVKIDRSFICNLETSDKDYSIVRAIIQLAHTLDKKVVAEGVENIQQESLLRELKCQWAQGFKYSKAIPVDQFILLLDQWEGLNPVPTKENIPVLKVAVLSLIHS